MHVARNETFAIVICLLIATGLTSCKDGQFTEVHFGGGKADLKWETLVTEAGAAKEKGKTANAEALYKEAIEKCVAAYGENDGRTATCVGYLAQLYMDKQDWRLAYETYKRWIKILQEIDPSGEQLQRTKESYKKIKEKLKQYGLADEIKKEQKELKEKELREKEEKELNKDVPEGRKRRVRSEKAIPDEESE